MKSFVYKGRKEENTLLTMKIRRYIFLSLPSISVDSPYLLVCSHLTS